MEAQFARTMLRAGARELARLSIRIGRAVQDGEPLGELDIMNDINRIGLAMARAGGIDVGIEGDLVDILDIDGET
jgi:hypothetical protein